MGEWNEFVDQQREEELAQIIADEKLKPQETRDFIETAFRDGEVKTTGTDIDKIMPPRVPLWRFRKSRQEADSH